MDKQSYISHFLRIIPGACLLFINSLLLSGCENTSTESTQAPVEAKSLQPQPLALQSDGTWAMGPYTQGRLHLRLNATPESGAGITFFNETGDSVNISEFEFLNHLPKEAKAPIQMRWNTDAALLTFEHADTICLQRILPFRDNHGIAVFRVDGGLFQVDSISHESLIPDPADVKVAYWGNALGPDGLDIAFPWNARLAEMIHSQGIFLRMTGDNSSQAQKPIPLSYSAPALERVLSTRPDFCILSVGGIDQLAYGGAGIPEFREALSKMLTMATASGTQPILLVLPPMPESASQKDKDLRLEYDNEMRSLAMNQGASVVDLWDRFRSSGSEAVQLQDENGILTQAGHELIASELSTLLQYYLQFTQRQ